MKIVTFLDNVTFHCITKIIKYDAHHMRAAGEALGVNLIACHCFNDLYSGKVLRKADDEIFICVAKGDYYNAVLSIDQIIDLFKAERIYWKVKGLRCSPQHFWSYQYSLAQPPCPMFDACE